MAQLAVIGGAAALGGVAGGLIPGVSVMMGAQIGFLGGSILAGILFPNEVDVGGPSRDDVRLSSAATGRFIPIPLVGSARIGGQYRWVDEPYFYTFKDEVGKGGGTEVTGTKMFLTWNVGICEAPDAGGIDAVTKVWLDDELVFDISEGNPIGPALLQKIFTPGSELPNTQIFDDTQTITVNSFGPIRIYLGTEGQPVEPLMQVDERITAAMGSDAVNWVSPANGLAHATFESVPGEAINGHFPQCEFEVLVNGNPVRIAVPYEPVQSRNMKLLLPDRSTILAIEGSSTGPYHTWNMIDRNAADQIVHEFGNIPDGRNVRPPTMVGTYDEPNWIVPVQNATSWQTVSGKTGNVVSPYKSVGVFGQPFAVWVWPNTKNPTRILIGGETQDQLFSIPFTWDSDADLTQEPLRVYRDPVDVPEVGITSLSFIESPGFVGPDGLMYISAGESNATRYGIFAIDVHTLDVKRAFLPYRESPDATDPLYGSFVMTYDIQHDKIICFGGGVCRKVDRATLTIEGDDIVGPFHGGNSNHSYCMHGPYGGKIWHHSGNTTGPEHSEVDIVGMRLLRTFDFSDEWENSETTMTGVYDPWNHGVWLASFFDVDLLDFHPLDRRGPACGSPKIIADNISDRCSVPTALRNTAKWADDLICGYMIGRRISGRRCLDVIAGAINGDYRTQDGVVDFYKNDTASIFTVPEDQLGYGDTLDAAVPRRDIRWPYERELPQRIEVQYIDRQMDYSSNTQPFDRPMEGFRGRDRQTVQMPIVFDEASDPTPLQIAERLLYQFDLNKESHLHVLSWEYLESNVGDSFSYIKGNRTHTVRIEKWALAENNKIVIQSKSEDIAINTGSGEAGNSGSLIFERPVLDHASGTSELFLIDATLLRDSDDAVSGVPVYLGVSPIGTTFKGGTVYRSVDDGASWEVVASFNSEQEMDWGYVTTANNASRIGLVDPSSMTVNMAKGTLGASVSEDDLDADRETNALWYGQPGRWELLRYRTAADTGVNDVIISNFRRGQANTEHNVANHGTNDRIVRPTRQNLVRLDMPVSFIGVAHLYKFIPTGTPDHLAGTVSFTLVGEAMKPPRQADHQGSRNISTGDWTVTWTPQGRIAYDWVDRVSTPLGEDAEEYEVDVLTGPGGSVVPGLTKTGLTSASATWTEVELVANGVFIDGSPGQSPYALTVQVYKISAKVGRGQTEEVTLSTPTPGN